MQFFCQNRGGTEFPLSRRGKKAIISAKAPACRGSHKRMGNRNVSVFDLFLVGIGLSMDAFAVSICKGLKMPRIQPVHTVVIAAFFGGFQMLMPLTGWLLGNQFAGYITSIDHWIAFGLLAIIGGNMIRESLGDEEEDKSGPADRLDLKELTLMAVATSIDALAVGVTFAFLNVSIGRAVSVIGSTTFTLSIVGVLIGHQFGARYKSKAELAGGIILILLGCKILLEGLGVLGAG